MIKNFMIKNLLLKACAIIGALCLMVGFIGLSVFLVSMNKNFYDREFQKYAVLEEDFCAYDDETWLDDESSPYYDSEYAALTQGELDRVRDKIIAYFGGRDSELQIYVDLIDDDGEIISAPFFTPIELRHMVDVKDVFIMVKTLTVILLTAGFLMLAAVLFFEGLPNGLRSFYGNDKGNDKGAAFCVKNGVKTLALGCCIAMSAIIAFLGAVGAYMLIDFDQAFTTFHHIFFPQGNWQFPSESNMLKILPEGLFMDAGINIVILGLSFTLLLGLAGLSYRIYIRIKAAKERRGKGAA